MMTLRDIVNFISILSISVMVIQKNSAFRPNTPLFQHSNRLSLYFIPRSATRARSSGFELFTYSYGSYLDAG